MATDIRVWTGTEWQSLVGEQGPIGPDGPDGPQGEQGERGPPGPSAVSANAGNATRLGTDNLVHTPVSPDAENEIRLRANGLYARTPDLNALRDVEISPPLLGHTLFFDDQGRWTNGTLISRDAGNTTRIGSDGKLFTPAVTDGGGGGGPVTGDFLPLTGGTLTGDVILQPPAATAGQISVVTEGGGNASLQTNRHSSDSAGPLMVFRKTRGTRAAQTAPLANDSMGNFRFVTVNAAGTACQSASLTATCVKTPVAGEPGVQSRLSLLVNDGTVTNAAKGLTILGDGTAQAERLIINNEAVIAQGGLNSTAIGPLNIEVKTADYQLQLTDAGKIITNGSTATTGIISFRIPANAVTPFPVGTVIEIMDASATTTAVVALAGVTLLWNSPNYTVSPSGSLSGGVGANARLRGRLTTARLLKAGTDTWYLFGDLEAT